MPGLGALQRVATAAARVVGYATRVQKAIILFLVLVSHASSAVDPDPSPQKRPVELAVYVVDISEIQELELEGVIARKPLGLPELPPD